jgi:uncharacterized integral membrane protein (TIGR00697 family)
MIGNTKKDRVLFVLSGIFITNALVAEMIGGKLITLGPFTLSIGILLWPIVFLTTDVINEYFGKKGVRALSFFTAGLIAYTFVAIYLAMQVKASHFSNVSDEQFRAVFGQTSWIIVGSITAFLVSQLIDVAVFWFLRSRTGERLIWLRATGSTVVSQLIDSFIVLGIGIYLPDAAGFYDKAPADRMQFSDFITIGLTGYSFKLIIAVGLTPLIYVAHHLINRYLGPTSAHRAIENSATESEN